MDEERKEELEIQKKAESKSTKIVIITDIFIATFMLLMMIGIPLEQIIVLSIIGVVVIALLSLGVKYTTYTYYIRQEEEKGSEQYVKKYLAAETQVEVIPIKASDYKSFITKALPRKVKFYANIDDKGFVEIYIKFNDNEDKVFFDVISKTNFKEYYLIKEELKARTRRKFKLEEGNLVEVIASPQENTLLAQEWLELTKEAKARYYAKEEKDTILVEIADETGKIFRDNPVEYKNYYTFYTDFTPNE